MNVELEKLIHQTSVDITTHLDNESMLEFLHLAWGRTWLATYVSGQLTSKSCCSDSERGEQYWSTTMKLILQHPNQTKTQRANKASEPWQHVPFKSDTTVARLYNCLQSLKPMALHWIRSMLIRYGKQHQIWTTKCQLKSYSLLKPSLSTCTNQIKPTCSVVGSGRFLWPVSSEHQKTRWPGCPDVPVV